MDIEDSGRPDLPASMRNDDPGRCMDMELLTRMLMSAMEAERWGIDSSASWTRDLRSLRGRDLRKRVIRIKLTGKIIRLEMMPM